MLKQLEKISSKTIFQNPYWDYKLDKYKMPNSEEGNYWYVHTEGSTMIIPILANGDFVLTKQFRYLNQKVSIEFPGGGISKGFSAEQNAIKELKEETGYTSLRINLIGKFNPYNGVTDEICHVFLAEELSSGESANESSEEIEIITISNEKIEQLIKSGELWDGMTIASLMLFRNFI